MTWTRGSIDGGETVNHTDDGDIHIEGKIDGGSNATLVSNHGSIIIDGKVDGGSTANLTAAHVSRIGAAGNDDGEKKIDGSSTVNAHADGDISVGHKIDDNSVVTLVSRLGSITIGGKIDHDSRVALTAAGNIRIGESGNDGGERKIDGNSHVDARAGGTIHLFNKIDGGSLSGKHSVVDFRACRGITIDDKIDGGSQVRLAVAPGRVNDENPPTIEIGDKIGGGGTAVLFWPPGSLNVENGIDSHGSATAVDWAGPLEMCNAGPSGYYWRNWPQTFGYVTDGRIYPRSLHELSEAVRTLTRPTKAVGGGWSFSDASLPFRTQPEIDNISILERGADGAEDFSHVLQGLNGVTNSPVDFQPENVDGDLPLSTHYDQTNLRELVDSGANLPFAENVNIIDIRGLASSLQSQLHSILSASARKATNPGPGGVPPSTFYFHVEAGITMADLDQLLDHQSPRLAIQASGGSPGATLAGSLSTATHGGEFRWPLLVDRVRAIHLVGPGGEEWWIEGATSIADHHRLQQIYHNIDHAHFIAGAWHNDGLTAEDVLNGVVVSMGTIGVIYSMVLEVVPQFGIQQIVTSLQQNSDGTTGWSQLLGKAGTSEAALRSGDAMANIGVLEFLLDGTQNGTTIGIEENVYRDLAINPFNRDCWITNRRAIPRIPIDSNTPSLGVGDYLKALDQTLGSHHDDTFANSKLLGRIFDFLGWATGGTGLINVPGQAQRLASFITTYPDVLASAVATINVQAVANTANVSDHPDRGQQFLGDLLTGLLNTLQATNRTFLNGNSNATDVSYKVGAVGWPSSGVPGRGLEIALPRETAFTFLQTVLFDDVLTNTMVKGNKPLIGYISIRVTPQTKTLMGMQQFSPHSVMVEVVAYRSPEANVVMDDIQQKALNPDLRRLDLMLHWGLENDQLTGADLARMPVNQPLRPGSPFTRLSAFKEIRKLLINGNSPVFDNNFVTRLSLNI
jgi:hypothetical protein